MGGYPHTWPFFTNFSNSKIQCFHLFFWQKCPKSSLVVYCIFRHIRGGVKPDATFVTFFFWKASLRLQGLTLTTVGLVILQGVRNKGDQRFKGYFLGGISGLSGFLGITLYLHFSKLKNTNHEFQEFIPFTFVIFIL